jgi:hypothetical protein
MKKIRYAVVLSLLVIAVVTGAALAEGLTIVDYPDTASDFTAVQSDDAASYIENGDFNSWGDDFVWSTWPDAAPSGWEVRGAKVDLSEGGDGMSYGMGFFIRNIGGSGGAYAGLVQPLNVPAAGSYFVNVSATAWWEVATSNYNSVAWYAISDSATAAGVMDSEWRELYPDKRVCENDTGHCNYIGRDEMVDITTGQYFHVKVGHKFPFFNSNTVFVIDDISVVAENPEEVNENGFYNWLDNDKDDEASCKWHTGDACADYYNTVTWNPAAPR